MSRIKVSPILVGVALVTLLVATQCSAPQMFTPELTPATVTLQLIGFPPESAEGQAEQQIIEQFQAAHPHVQVEHTLANEPFEDALASSSPPELMWVSPTFPLAKPISQGQLTDLTEVWLQSGLLESHPAGLQALSAREGKQYYVPLAYGWAAIYYNKTIFAQYNLTPPQTWEEFFLVCDTLLTNGVTPLALSSDLPTGIMWFEYLNLRLNGAAFHRNLLAGKISYEDARVRKVLETWQQLFTHDYFIEDPYRYDDRSSLRTVIPSGVGSKSQPKAAMILTDSLLVGELPVDSQAELDFFSFPILDPAMPVAESLIVIGYATPVKAAHAPEALAFLTYLASAEAQTTLAKHLAVGSVTVAPTRTDIDPAVLTPALRKVLALVKASNDLVPTFWTISDYALIEVLEQEYGQFLSKPHAIDPFILKLEEARLQAAQE